MYVENSLIKKQVNEFSLIAKNVYTYIERTRAKMIYALFVG
jgi:hypothetical protein